MPDAQERRPCTLFNQFKMFKTAVGRRVLNILNELNNVQASGLCGSLPSSGAPIFLLRRFPLQLAIESCAKHRALVDQA